MGMGFGKGRGGPRKSPGEAAPPAAPVNSQVPIITASNNMVGFTATCDGGLWSGSPTLAYQWQRDGVDITDETAATYPFAVADIGADITCNVTATNVGGATGPVASNALGPIAAQPALAALTLSASSIEENAAPGTVVGTVEGLTTGSTPSITDTAGSRFDLLDNGDGTYSIIAGAVSTNYESATSHNITLREALSYASNTPRDTVIPISVENIPNLASALGGTFTLAENAAEGATAGSITGKTSGSTLSLVDDAEGRVALIGTNIVRGATSLDWESATSHSFTVRETLTGAENGPYVDTIFPLTVTDVSDTGGGGTITQPVISLASNLPGDAPPAWDIDYVDPAPDGAAYGDTIRLRYATSEAGLDAATPVDEVLDDELIEEPGGTIAPALFTAEFDPWATAQTVGTTLWWDVQVIRNIGEVDEETSDRSAAASYEIVDGTPNAVAFTDVTGAALDTEVWSAPITIAGLASGAYARFTIEAGGQMRVTRSGEVTPEAATTEEVQVQNGDQLAVAVQSSALNAVATTVEVYQRGALYDTFSVTTVAAAGLDIQRVDQGIVNAPSNTQTLTARALGGADADREIIFMLCGRDNTGVPTSVTIGGIAATKREEVQSGSYGLSVWTAAVPTGTTGDIVISWPASQSRMGFGVYRMVNGNPVPVSTGEIVDEVSGTTLSRSPTIPADTVLLAMAAGGTSGQTHSWSGATEEYEAYMSGTNISAFSLARSDTPGSPTLTVTYSGASTSRAMLYAVFGE